MDKQKLFAVRNLLSLTEVNSKCAKIIKLSEISLHADDHVDGFSSDTSEVGRYIVRTPMTDEVVGVGDTTMQWQRLYSGDKLMNLYRNHAPIV